MNLFRANFGHYYLIGIATVLSTCTFLGFIIIRVLDSIDIVKMPTEDNFNVLAKFKGLLGYFSYGKDNNYLFNYKFISCIMFPNQY